MFRLQAGEAITVALPRILREQHGDALAWLGGTDRALESRVHEARKCLKRLRAVLDLARGALPEASRKELAACVREAAHALADARSASALHGCLDDLLARDDAGIEPSAAERLRHALDERPLSVDDVERAVHTARSILLRQASAVSALQLSRDGWSALEPGFRATYRRARRAFHDAGRGAPLETWHALRIPAKRHGYHLELLEPLWPGPLKALRLELEELGELLGGHHDLALLQREIAQKPALGEAGSDADALIERRLRKLEKQADALGRRVFAERPRRLSRRFEIYLAVFTS